MINNKLPHVSAGHLLLATLAAFIIAAFTVAALTMIPDLNPAESLENLDTVAGRQKLRLSLLLSNWFLFAGTGILALIFAYRGRWLTAAGLTQRVAYGSLLWSAGLFVAAIPFVSWLAYLNLQLELPEWMQQSEDAADTFLAGILTMETPWEFLLALVTAAVVPAIGEELLLRGIVQRRMLRPLFGNPHVAIWVAAAVFSAMHLEFGGFAPRLLLGVLLGYAYYWSRSLWVPILLHFLFNGLQVLTAYVSGDFDPKADMTDVPAAWMGVVSLLLAVAVWYFGERKFGHAVVEDQV